WLDCETFRNKILIIGAEDEDFENDLNEVGEDQCTCFSSIEVLKERPAHLLVFIQHVILQFDPAPLLCYLHADLFKNLSTKETKKQLVEFYNTFLDKGAVNRTRPELLTEEAQRRFAQEIQSLQVAEVAKQLEDFRQKRMMGMTPNEAELIDVENHYPTDRIPMEMKEKSVAENLLDKMSETQSVHVFCRTLPLLSSPEGMVTVPDGPGPSPTGPPPQVEEMEPRLLEFEQDPPNWRELASPDALSSLSKKQIKRQEVINELFATEHAHVRMLSVLQMVFSKPLEREELLTSTELATIFPNLDEIIEMHYCFYENLKKLRLEDGYIVKSISTTVLNRFGGTEGEWFQKLTARFCSHQSWALDQIKSRQRKEPRFNSFILEAESKPQCRRLQLKDIIPIEMQRLTKYPLLLENIAKNTEDLTEKERIQQSAECCRRILNHVNEEVKVMENLLVRNTQPITQHTVCVLLGDLLVLLQRLDDKMVLKCQSKSNIAAQEGKQMLSPIIKLDSVFLREVATDRKAFYVIFTWDSGAQIYELVAQSVGERKTWTDVIKDAVDDLKKSGAPMRLSLPPGGGGPPFSPST
uniref:DH domain-containing protein n=1 Tax=Sphaeramia orbicularis TaxID=375764 RepID=A0A673CST5_9TELE